MRILRVLSQVFKKHFPEAGVHPQRLRLQLLQRVAGLEEAVAAAAAVGEVARGVMEMKVIGDSVLGLKDEVHRRVDDALDRYKRRGGAVARLAAELSKAGSVGPAVVHEHKVFAGWNIQVPRPARPTPRSCAEVALAPCLANPGAPHAAAPV